MYSTTHHRFYIEAFLYDQPLTAYRCGRNEVKLLANSLNSLHWGFCIVSTYHALLLHASCSQKLTRSSHSSPCLKNNGIKTSIFRFRMIRFGTELQCIVMVGSGRSRDGEREGEGREGMTEPLSFWGEGGRLQRDKIIYTISYLPKHKWTTWHCMFFQITTETCSFVHNLTGASCSSFEFVSEYLIACHVTSKGFEFESKLHKSLILSYTLLWDSVVGVGQFVGCVFY